MCLGIPGQVVEIVDASQHKAIAEVDGVRREINVGLV
ncbi:MAG: HypC/HybG/HupF family hydrogenase formation chaperone, partial [Acidimicrobiales bacterium]